MLRLILIPIIIVVLYWDFSYSFFIAFGLIIVAGLTDIFDGIIARKYNLKTEFGAFMDPFVDKLMIISLFIVLLDLGLVPGWIVLLLIARDIFTQGVRSAMNAKGKILKSEVSGKVKALLQIITILFAIFLSAIFKAGLFTVFLDTWTLTLIFWVALITLIESYIALAEFFVKNRKVLLKIV